MAKKENKARKAVNLGERLWAIPLGMLLV